MGSQFPTVKYTEFYRHTEQSNSFDILKANSSEQNKCTLQQTLRVDVLCRQQTHSTVMMLPTCR